jgi:hypothetical protein
MSSATCSWRWRRLLATSRSCCHRPPKRAFKAFSIRFQLIL